MEGQTFNEKKIAFSNKLEEMIPSLSALQSFAIGKELNKEEVQTIRDFKSVQAFLDMPLNDVAENGIKKLFATAIIVANQKGILKLPEGYANAESIASIVDEGLTRIKTAYQVGKGIINPIEADATIADRLAIRTASIVDVVASRLEEKAQMLVNVVEQKALSVSDTLVEQGISRASNIICAFVARAYPPAIVVVPFIKRVEAFVTPIAKVAVKKGIRMVAETARNMITVTSEKVKSFAKSNRKNIWIEMKLTSDPKPVKFRIVSGGEEHSSLDSLRRNFCIEDLQKNEQQFLHWLSRQGKEGEDIAQELQAMPTALSNCTSLEEFFEVYKILFKDIIPFFHVDSLGKVVCNGFGIMRIDI